MEQELRKCIFDERETGLVYLQNTVDEVCTVYNTLKTLIIFDKFYEKY